MNFYFVLMFRILIAAARSLEEIFQFSSPLSLRNFISFYFISSSLSSFCLIYAARMQDFSIGIDHLYDHCVIRVQWNF